MTVDTADDYHDWTERMLRDTLLSFNLKSFTFRVFL